MYILVRAISRIVTHSFFREVTVLNPERIPVYGPVIFVGNHNNQFVDASLLCSTLPRTIRFLIAQVSLARPIVGWLAQTMGTIGVARPQDKVYRGIGAVSWVEGSTEILGHDTRFSIDLHAGDTIRIQLGPDHPSQQIEVQEIIDDTHLVASEKLPAQLCNQEDPSKPSEFVVLPRVDQSEVYRAVVASLCNGEAVGIFPEGGSHDRRTLLPFKPGVAVMAVRAALQGAEDVMVVPIGINYYQAHRILSRAVVHVGTPLVVREDLLHLYSTDRRAAIAQLLREIESSVASLIVSAPNYRSLGTVRVCTSLYVPESVTLSGDRFHIVYHQLSKLFNRFDADPRFTQFIENVRSYEDMLLSCGIADHEVRSLHRSMESVLWSTLDIVLLLILSLVVGCSLAPLWAPVRFISSLLAERHRVKALANSKVKVKGMDVVASYKILCMIVLIPLCNLLYTLIYAVVFYRGSLLKSLLVIAGGQVLLPICYHHSIRYFAKIRPLIRRLRFSLIGVASRLNVWREEEAEIVNYRLRLQLELRRVVAECGPETEADFLEQLEKCVPAIVVGADSRRIARRLEKGKPTQLSGRVWLDTKEEIL